MSTAFFKSTEAAKANDPGEWVTVIRPLVEGVECDAEVGPMFRIRTAQGTEQDAFGDELSEERHVNTFWVDGHCIGADSPEVARAEVLRLYGHEAGKVRPWTAADDAVEALPDGSTRESGSNPVLEAFRRDVLETDMTTRQCARSWVDGEAWEVFEDIVSAEELRLAVKVLRRLSV